MFSAVVSLVLSAVLLLARPAAAVSSTGSRVLVALDRNLNQEDYSGFWSDLRGRGYTLTFKGPKEETPALTEYEEKSFDHLILFTPTTKSFSSDLNPQSLVTYLSQKGNILLVLSSSISEQARDFAREFSLEFQPSPASLMSHFAYSPSLDNESSPHTALYLSPSESLVKNPAVLSTATINGAPILYRGVAHSVGSSPLLVPILRAPKSAYSAEPRTGESADDSPYPSDLLLGERAALVSAMQTLDNSRITFVGSVELFSDKFWGGFKSLDGKQYESSGNRNFAADISAWTFQEKGVLRATSPRHHLRNADGPRTLDGDRSSYRIKDEVTFSVQLEQHVTSASNISSWVPFRASDLQLSFTMLDPHVRTALPPVEDSATGEHRVDFMIPDRHGVFKFVIDHKRPGYSYIHESHTAAVVPFRHNEYPRFLSGAGPFYGGALSTMVAFMTFCTMWLLWGRDVDEEKKRK